ncbi:hypothetical protein CPB85DRAFT_1441642 [Mucidula mucida]|nr:hypothetical protein CPB85DRAFT_1448980 [Mucidula mucida]KAF8887679.1 hypothetical protein CPB85DRAFT_1441642 [Mucidula mucida]
MQKLPYTCAPLTETKEEKCKKFLERNCQVSLKCRQRKKALASPFPSHHVPPPPHASPLHNVIITTGRTLRQLVQRQTPTTTTTLHHTQQLKPP